jgi:hypothetical protein
VLVRDGLTTWTAPAALAADHSAGLTWCGASLYFGVSA